IVKNSKKAAKIAKRGVEVGGTDAMILLAGLYRDGAGVKLDRKKMMQLFRMAADRGHPQAQLMIGIFHRDSEKFDEAFHYFKLSAEQGLKLGERALGCAYARGHGVATSLLEAVRWYERAAAKGDQKAVDVLAKLEDHGAQDELRAFHYFKLSAEQGFTQGERALGDAYINGQGVGEDPVEAMGWLGRAAAKGEWGAVTMVAKVKAGQGVAQDPLEAMRWYERAAAKGD
ncbi:hypothetical protein AURANDRAFT_4690, partial [Aureococcus anophagefferens]